MVLIKDHFVIHEKLPTWGVGKVVDIINQDLAEVFFEHGGYRKFNRKNNPLTQADTSDINTDIFENINCVNEDKKVLYQDLPSSQKYFLQEFPGGFNGEKYHEHERDYKDVGHALAVELLNQKSYEQLLDSREYEELIVRALKIANKLNLIFPNEKMALKDGLKDDTNKELFAHSLYQLLYSSGELKDRFKGWIKTLEIIGADKWTIASYFLFIIHPDKYMFVKPTVTQAVADMSAFDIAYSAKLNWTTYSKVLKFSEHLKQALHELRPKDMIDVQSFMWCIERS